MAPEAAQPEDRGHEHSRDERDPAAAPLPRSAGAKAAQLAGLHPPIVLAAGSVGVQCG